MDFYEECLDKIVFNKKQVQNVCKTLKLKTDNTMTVGKVNKNNHRREIYPNT